MNGSLGTRSRHLGEGEISGAVLASVPIRVTDHLTETIKEEGEVDRGSWSPGGFNAWPLGSVFPGLWSGKASWWEKQDEGSHSFHGS